MNNFIDRFKSGAGKAAFEADKLKRITLLQAKIRPLQDTMNKTYLQLGQLTYDLYRRGQVDQSELQSPCVTLVNLQEQITQLEKQIEQVRSEVYQYVSDQTVDLPICPNGHGFLAPGNQFCTVCGKRGVYQQASMPTGELCAQCGSPLPDDARFCSNCGYTVPIAPRCQNCNARVAADAVFCSECGTPVLAKQSRTHTGSHSDTHLETELETQLDPQLVKELDTELDTGLDTELDEQQNISSSMTEIDATVLDHFDSYSPTVILSESANKLPATCPECNSTLPRADLVFCPKCGHHLGTATA